MNTYKCNFFRKIYLVILLWMFHFYHKIFLLFFFCESNLFHPFGDTADADVDADAAAWWRVIALRNPSLIPLRCFPYLLRRFALRAADIISLALCIEKAFGWVIEGSEVL